MHYSIEKVKLLSMGNIDWVGEKQFQVLMESIYLVSTSSRSKGNPPEKAGM